MMSNKPVEQTTDGTPGTPYSVGEARKVVITHLMMQPYHRELILWLCDEVDRLTAALPCPDPEPVPKEELLDYSIGRRGRERNLAGSLFLSAFTHTFPMGKGDKHPDAQKLFDAKDIKLVLLANGIPLDAMKACAEWEKQVERMIADKAREMILDKLGDDLNAIDELLESTKNHIKDKMLKAGIQPSDEED